jgi:hypothetical protein
MLKRCTVVPLIVAAGAGWSEASLRYTGRQGSALGHFMEVSATSSTQHIFQQSIAGPLGGSPASGFGLNANVSVPFNGGTFGNFAGTAAATTSASGGVATFNASINLSNRLSISSGGDPAYSPTIESIGSLTIQFHSTTEDTFVLTSGALFAPADTAAGQTGSQAFSLQLQNLTTGSFLINRSVIEGPTASGVADSVEQEVAVTPGHTYIMTMILSSITAAPYTTSASSMITTDTASVSLAPIPEPSALPLLAAAGAAAGRRRGFIFGLPRQRASKDPTPHCDAGSSVTRDGSPAYFNCCQYSAGMSSASWSAPLAPA